MAKIILICFALFAFATAERERQLLHDIANSVSRARTLPPSFFADEVCYQDLGCFHKDGPMKQTGAFPWTPEEIGTKFYAYGAGQKSSSAIVDPYKPETFSSVDSTKRVVFLIHGFGMSYTNQQLNDLKNNLLEHTNGEVGTVIIVDWAKGAASPDYLAASTNTQVVGRQVAHLVNELKKHHSVDPHNVYLIGFSLGAQVSGFAGKFSQSQYNWKLGRITGLDAAAPMFEAYTGSHLTKDDAEFVDGIHSSAGSNILMGEVGFVESYAHVDFFPNGGKKQPHCGLFSGITCNHYGSVLFYDASLHAKSSCKFNGAPCTSWADYQAKKCSGYDSELGYWAHQKFTRSHAIGTRFLATTKKTPFCR